MIGPAHSMFPSGTRAAASLLLLLPTLACNGDANANLEASLIHTVRRADLTITIRERGEISAARNIKVVSELEGRATLIYLVPEGTFVEKGDKLAEMDTSGIDEKRTLEEISVAKAEAAVQQARKSVEIVETELTASEKAAESLLRIAELRAKKLMGQPQAEEETGWSAGTNAQVVKELRDLHANDHASDEKEPVDGLDEAQDPGVAVPRNAKSTQRPTSTNLVQRVLSLYENSGNLGLQMGEIGNQILKQISLINLARADLAVATDALVFSEKLAAQGFITRNELSRDRINHQRGIAEVNLAWNDLDLMVNFTLPESMITSRQEVSNARLTLKSVHASSEARRVREASELASAEAEFKVAKKRLDNWNEQIAKAVLHAPGDGLVVYGRYDWDEPVYEGMEIRERQDVVILPDITTMVAELLVHEAQIDQVAVGQLATIEVDAFPEREFSARVTSVSTLPDVRGSWRRDIKVYTVRVEIEGSNDNGALRPGMNSTIRIDVGTLANVILIPLPALERNHDRHFVWRSTSSGPVATEVTVGANNLTHVEIVTGLSVGDRVYLVPPIGAELPDPAALDAAAESTSVADEAKDAPASVE